MHKWLADNLDFQQQVVFIIFIFDKYQVCVHSLGFIAVRHKSKTLTNITFVVLY